MMRPALIAVVIATLAALYGCGGSADPQSNPKSALKTYDLAWAEGNAKEACELLSDGGRRAVEQEMSDRTLGGLPLVCAARMKEILELLGPESKAALEELADKVSSDKTREAHGEAVILIGHDDLMGLRETDGSWYIAGSTIKEIEPFLPTQEEVEEFEAEQEEPEEVEEEGFTEAEGAAAAAEDGFIDPVTHERTLEETLDTRLHEAVSYVSCPSGIQAEPGKRYVCLAEMESGNRYTITYRITDAAGDLSELSQEPNSEY